MCLVIVVMTTVMMTMMMFCGKQADSGINKGDRGDALGWQDSIAAAAVDDDDDDGGDGEGSDADKDIGGRAFGRRCSR